MKTFENIKKEQIKLYTDMLSEGEFLLLKSSDEYYKNHYTGSPLNVLTNFSGTEGEALIDKSGKVTLFVDTRYHLLADKQVFSDVEVYKIPLGISFFEAFKDKYKKGTRLFVPDDIALSEYLEFDKYFDIRKYKPNPKYALNYDVDETKQIFLVDENIEKSDFAAKIEKYKKLNPQIERRLIFDLDEISYFTNLRSYKSLYSSNFKSILYLDISESNFVLFMDRIEQLKKIKINKLRVLALDEFCDYINSIEKPIHINANEITLDKFLHIKKPIHIKKDNLRTIVSIKPLSVIEHLKESFKRLDIAIDNFKKNLKVGLSEYDLAEMFNNELKSAGAIAQSFKTLLAIDENSACIHYPNYDKNKKLKEESILLLDCGGYYEGGYATDITRTFYFGKNPKPIHKKVYTYVLKAFLDCYLSKCTNARELDNKAREILSPLYDDGFNFNHGLGHGIGTSVHQNPPRLCTTTNDIIKPYQVHSIEPGLYGKSISEDIEFGVRIENCVYSDINYNKISLSKFPFEDILIDYSILNINEIETIKAWQRDFE